MLDRAAKRVVCMKLQMKLCPSKHPNPFGKGKSTGLKIDQGVAEIEVKTVTGGTLQKSISGDSPQEHLTYMLNTLNHDATKVIDRLSEIDVVGHRIVHGGEDYRDSVVITEDVKKAIAQQCWQLLKRN